MSSHYDCIIHNYYCVFVIVSWILLKPIIIFYLIKIVFYLWNNIYLSGVLVRHLEGGGDLEDARNKVGSSYRRDTTVKSWCASISFWKRETISKSETDAGTSIPRSLAMEFLLKVTLFIMKYNSKKIIITFIVTRWAHLITITIRHSNSVEIESVNVKQFHFVIAINSAYKTRRLRANNTVIFRVKAIRPGE